jgi:hypothetical protein
MKSQPRVDPLVAELIGGINGNEDAVAASFAFALSNVIISAGKNIGEASRTTILELVSDSSRSSQEESLAVGIAQVAVAMTTHSELFTSWLSNFLETSEPRPVVSQTLLLLIDEAPDYLISTSLLPRIVHKVVTCIGAEDTTTSRPAREAKEILKSRAPYVADDIIQNAF